MAAIPPRRSWFAVWRWTWWWVWGISVTLLAVVYVASAPLGLYIANQCVRTDSVVLWWLSDAAWWFYHPVNVCGDWYEPLGDFLNWEYTKIALFFDPNDW